MHIYEYSAAPVAPQHKPGARANCCRATMCIGVPSPVADPIGQAVGDARHTAELWRGAPRGPVCCVRRACIRVSCAGTAAIRYTCMNVHQHRHYIRTRYSSFVGRGPVAVVGVMLTVYLFFLALAQFLCVCVAVAGSVICEKFFDVMMYMYVYYVCM